MSTATQRSIDLAHDVAMNAEDSESEHAATVARDAIDAAYGLKIYCPQHCANHHLGVIQLETLIYGLVGDRADSMSESDLGDTRAGWEIANDWCPLNDLKWMRDAETYSEHIDSWVESRQNAKLMVEVGK